MNSVYSNYEQLPIIITAPEVARILRISRSNAYALLHSKEIETIRIGKRMLVAKDELIRYIEEKSKDNC